MKFGYTSSAVIEVIQKLSKSNALKNWDSLNEGFELLHSG